MIQGGNDTEVSYSGVFTATSRLVFCKVSSRRLCELRRGSLLGILAVLTRNNLTVLSTTATIAQNMMVRLVAIEQHVCITANNSPDWTSEMLLSAKNHLVVHF